jgi:hypothetical protein
MKIVSFISKGQRGCFLISPLLSSSQLWNRDKCLPWLSILQLLQSGGSSRVTCQVTSLLNGCSSVGGLSTAMVDMCEDMCEIGPKFTLISCRSICKQFSSTKCVLSLSSVLIQQYPSAGNVFIFPPTLKCNTVFQYIIQFSIFYIISLPT